MNPLSTDHVDYAAMPTEWARIIIDGDNGSGKTTLAKEMSAALNAKVVSLDDHLLENGDIYWNQIKYQELASEIVAAGPRVIIEGVCVLKVLGKINVNHDYHIFVKRYNGFLGWEYEQYLDERAKLPRSKLSRDIAAYYRACKPFNVCNLVLDRSF
jgi:ABC-type cobalamin/Fe3+-siderophores transport system ATPase subunit